MSISDGRLETGETLGSKREQDSSGEEFDLNVGCRNVLTYFIGQPEFAVQHADVGVHVREQNNLTVDQWREVAKELIDKHLMFATKSQESLLRPDTLGVLIPEELPEGSPPYLDEALIQTAKQAIQKTD